MQLEVCNQVDSSHNGQREILSAFNSCILRRVRIVIPMMRIDEIECRFLAFLRRRISTIRYLRRGRVSSSNQKDRAASSDAEYRDSDAQRLYNAKRTMLV